MKNKAIFMQNITKMYPNGFVANSGIDFSVSHSEIHALMGENGCGKSTLMKILFGMERPTSGKIFLDGVETQISSPNVAISKGIGMVHQHFMLVPPLSVAENLMLGIEPDKYGIFNKKKAYEITEEICIKYGFNLSPSTIVSDLPVASKQKLEILKTLVRGCKTIILDEPTAVLTPQETEELFVELKKLKNENHNIIFISHKLREIKEITDKITIVRTGKLIGEYNTKDVSVNDIAKLMIGRDVSSQVAKSVAKPKENVLRVKNLKHTNGLSKVVLDDVTFSVRSGEVLGIAGVEGNGQLELVEIISGMQKKYSGSVEVKEKNIKDLGIREIREIGVGIVHQDRMSVGCALDESISENIIVDRYYRHNFSGTFLLRVKNIINFSLESVKSFVIKCKSIYQPISGLSGGNMQKVVIAREFSLSPSLLILDQPTRGVDIGSAQFIHEQIIKMRDSGTATLLVSADLSEVMSLSDSLIVMYGGKISAYFNNLENLTEEEVGYYMLGVKKQSTSDILESFK